MSIVNCKVFRYLIFISVAVVIASCSPRAQQLRNSEVSDLPHGPRLTKVDVVDLSHSTQIILEAEDAVQYTSYTLSEPPRLVIDMPDISIGEFKEPIEVNRGAIVGIYPIEADPPGRSARLDIRLIDDSIRPQIYKKGNSIVVETPAESVTGGMTVGEVVSQDDVKTGAEPEAKPEGDAAPVLKQEAFTNIKEVRLEMAGSRTDVIINADKDIDAETFMVEGNRVVIDVKNAIYPTGVNEIPVDNNNALSRVRIGRHLSPVNKVRIVGDLKEKITYEANKEENLFRLSIIPQNTTAPTKDAAPPVSQTADQTAEPEKGKEPVSETIQAPVPTTVITPETTGKTVSPGGAKETLPAASTTLEKAAQKPLNKRKVNSSAEDVTAPPAAPPSRYTGKKVSLDFQDADIINVLRLLAEVSRLNMVIGDNVKGKITIKMLDVPWDHALDVILKMKGLGKVFEDNVLRVDTLSNISQQQEEEAKAKEAMVKAEDLLTKIYPVSYAKARDISDSIKKTLSTRGDITVDDRTNTMIIKDIANKHREISRLLETLDKPTPQVLIEARIVQADSNFARDLGIQWGGGYTSTSFDSSIGVVGGPAGPPGFPPAGFVVNLPAAGRAGIKGNLGFSFGKVGGNVLDLRLSAGETKGLTKILSAPKIATLDNKEATIQQGESIPYKTFSQEGTKTEFIDATLTLKVTPKVTPDGHIAMNIKITKNRPGSMVVEGTPSVSKKEATTEVLVKDGETTVIGGIYETEDIDNVGGVPWFYKIPILGLLFKNTQKSNVKNELLIFITPKIIPVST